MSDNNVCPICGLSFFSTGCPHTYAEIAAEFARLKAELERAERDIETQRKCIGVTADERDRAQSVLNAMENNRDYWIGKCDEARRLARHFYRMYLAVGFDNSWDV